jgi:hypothetical protein
LRALRDKVSFGAMGESLLQQQLDEVRELLERARELFGPQPVAPPDDFAQMLDPYRTR